VADPPLVTLSDPGRPREPVDVLGAEPPRIPRRRLAAGALVVAAGLAVGFVVQHQRGQARRADQLAAVRLTATASSGSSASVANGQLLLSRTFSFDNPGDHDLLLRSADLGPGWRADALPVLTAHARTDVAFTRAVSCTALDPVLTPDARLRVALAGVGERALTVALPVVGDLTSAKELCGLGPPRDAIRVDTARTSTHGRVVTLFLSLVWDNVQDAVLTGVRVDGFVAGRPVGDVRFRGRPAGPFDGFSVHEVRVPLTFAGCPDPARSGTGAGPSGTVVLTLRGADGRAFAHVRSLDPLQSAHLALLIGLCPPGRQP
jgi:hypothetical protein